MILSKEGCPPLCEWASSNPLKICFLVLIDHLKIIFFGSSHCDSAVTTLNSIHEDTGLIPGLAYQIKDLALLWALVGHRCSSDPEFLWLWCGLAASIPSLGTSISHRCGPKKTKTNKQTNFFGDLSIQFHPPFPLIYLFIYLFIFVFLPFSRAAPTAYGGSQARGVIRAVATGHSHSNQHRIRAVSATYTTATPDP